MRSLRRALLLLLVPLSVAAFERPYRQGPNEVSGLTPLPGNVTEVAVTAPGTVFVPPSVKDIPDNDYGDLVRKGRDIFTDTQRHAPRFAGNGLNCSSCHLQEGRKADAAPLWGAFSQFPEYRGKNQQVNTFEMRLQDCFRFSLDGLAPPLDSPEMRALMAYAQWLSSGAPARKLLPGRGFVPTKREIEPSPDRGKVVYDTKCALCHGADGEGVKNADGVGYQFPPLWGDDSYNRAAGMHTVRTAASFIKGNMPLGRPNSLSDQEAYDVALYMRLHDRPIDPRIGIMSDFMRMFAGF